MICYGIIANEFLLVNSKYKKICSVRQKLKIRFRPRGLAINGWYVFNQRHTNH